MANEKVPAGPWDDLMTTFVMKDVRIVATLQSDGGALVETVSKLICEEGRCYAITGNGPEEVRTFTLEYAFWFRDEKQAELFASESVEGRIVITGQHSSGLRMEVRGSGWIGYDQDGRIEGKFEAPPVIITEEMEDTEEDEDSDQVSPIELHKHFGRQYAMPVQFVQATVRVPERDYD